MSKLTCYGFGSWNYSLCISCIRLVLVGMGALALLVREEELSPARKGEAIKLVGERMMYVLEARPMIESQ